jgi:hypothetical protein
VQTVAEVVLYGDVVMRFVSGSFQVRDIPLVTRIMMRCTQFRRRRHKCYVLHYCRKLP